MRAILPQKETSNAMQPHNKETTQTRTVTGYKNGELTELITARWYMGRSSQASVVYCCVWVHGKPFWMSGKGQAGGYGYHKYSAAFAAALSSAGIKLVGSPYHGTETYYEETQTTRNEDGTLDYKRVKVKQNFKRECHIGGCGDTSIDDALTAISAALGFKKIHISRG